MTHEGYWSVALWNYRVFPVIPYSNIMGLSPYGWILIFQEALVEHCQQPPMGVEKVGILCKN